MQNRLFSLPYFRNIDWVLLLAIVPILLAGLGALWPLSGNDLFFHKQLISITVSIVVFFLASLMDPRIFRKSSFILSVYAICLLLLLLLFIVGRVSHGAQSWFSFGLFAFQPVDLMKVVLILILAKYFSRRHVEIAHIRHIIVSGMYMAIPFLLVFFQPDFGSAMILIMIWFGMVLASGLSRKHLLILTAVGAILFVGLYSFVFEDYQKKRIANFLNPLSDIHGSGYNVLQSTIAVGSGQAFGKGLGFGTQSRLQFLPESETDFIFAAFAEEWGFVGVLILLTLYVIVIIRILMTALYGSSNFEILFGVGLALMFLSHIVINIGMNMGIMPVTGITLPFMSYGGSHLIASFFGLGILQAMRRYSRSFHRDDINKEFLGVEREYDGV
jgi:rod shape determining protein RodA